MFYGMMPQMITQLEIFMLLFWLVKLTFSDFDFKFCCALQNLTFLVLQHLHLIYSNARLQLILVLQTRISNERVFSQIMKLIENWENSKESWRYSWWKLFLFDWSSDNKLIAFIHDMKITHFDTYKCRLKQIFDLMIKISINSFLEPDQCISKP